MELFIVLEFSIARQGILVEQASLATVSSLPKLNMQMIA